MARSTLTRVALWGCLLTLTGCCCGSCDGCTCCKRAGNVFVTPDESSVEKLVNPALRTASDIASKACGIPVAGLQVVTVKVIEIVPDGTTGTIRVSGHPLGAVVDGGAAPRNLDGGTELTTADGGRDESAEAVSGDGGERALALVRDSDAGGNVGKALLCTAVVLYTPHAAFDANYDVTGWTLELKGVQKVTTPGAEWEKPRELESYDWD